MLPWHNAFVKNLNAANGECINIHILDETVMMTAILSAACQRSVPSEEAK
jgi:hypothetical protein